MPHLQRRARACIDACMRIHRLAVASCCCCRHRRCCCCCSTGHCIHDSRSNSAEVVACMHGRLHLCVDTHHWSASISKPAHTSRSPISMSLCYRSTTPIQTRPAQEHPSGRLVRLCSCLCSFVPKPYTQNPNSLNSGPTFRILI